MKCDISPKLLRQLRVEASNPDWLEGFAAFDKREPLDMSKGHNWALGWLTCRLVGARVITASRH